MRQIQGTCGQVSLVHGRRMEKLVADPPTKLLPQMLLVGNCTRIGWYQSEEQMAASRVISTRFAAA